MGWKAELAKIEKTQATTSKKKTKEEAKDKKEKKKEEKMEMECDLVPKYLLIQCYFALDKKALEELESNQDNISRELEELIEEYSGEEGYFSALDKVSKDSVKKRIKELGNSLEDVQERKVLESYWKLADSLAEEIRKSKLPRICWKAKYWLGIQHSQSQKSKIWLWMLNGWLP